MLLKKISLLLSALVLTSMVGLPANAQQAPAGQAVTQKPGNAGATVFALGDVIPEAYRQKVVKNPYHQGLTPPKSSEQWVQVGRTFYKIEKASGKVADRVGR